MENNITGLLAESCPCAKAKCPRKRNCVECISFHRKDGSMTACMSIVASKMYEESEERFFATLARYRNFHSKAQKNHNHKSATAPIP